MMWTRFGLTAAVVAASAVADHAGQAAGVIQAVQRDRIDVSRLGPQLGDRVPDFSLRDQNGKMWTRQSIMGPRGAMLVFVRSADW